MFTLGKEPTAERLLVWLPVRWMLRRAGLSALDQVMFFSAFADANVDFAHEFLVLIRR